MLSSHVDITHEALQGVLIILVSKTFAALRPYNFGNFISKIKLKLKCTYLIIIFKTEGGAGNHERHNEKIQ